MVELKKRSSKDVATLTKPAEALVNTKEVLNQAVADLYMLYIALHQELHWYMRGRGFMWHPKMDESWM